MIWQDIALIILVLFSVGYWLYNAGYRDGYNRAEFVIKQDAIRKTGNYFISQNGTLIPVPPMPPITEKCK